MMGRYLTDSPWAANRLMARLRHASAFRPVCSAEGLLLDLSFSATAASQMSLAKDGGQVLLTEDFIQDDGLIESHHVLSWTECTRLTSGILRVAQISLSVLS